MVYLEQELLQQHSWTEVNNLNTARMYAGTTGLSSTNALLFGGLAAPGDTANTESWDGTSWTELNNLATARQSLSGAGASSSSALAFGGRSGPAAGVNATEEWTFSHPIKTVTTS